MSANELDSNEQDDVAYKTVTVVMLSADLSVTVTTDAVGNTVVAGSPILITAVQLALRTEDRMLQPTPSLA